MKYRLIYFICGLSLCSSLFAITAPTPTGPTNGLMKGFSRQTFAWKSVSGCSYELQIDTTRSFSSPLRIEKAVSSTTSSTASVTVYDMHYGTHYYWHVRALKGEEVSEWSEIWELTTSNMITLIYEDAPDVTGKYYPSQTLTWNIHCGSRGYVVEVDTTESFNSPALLRKNVSWSRTEGKGTASVDVTNLYLGTMNYWRVRGYNDADSTLWSETRRFHTLSQAVAQFPKEMTTALTQQTFEWKYQRGLNNVIIEYDTCATFDSPELKTVKSFGSDQDNCYVTISKLRFNTTYYWHVKSYHSRDTTEWSDPLSFHTYTHANLSSPSDSATYIITSPYLYFKYHKGISNYQMQIDTAKTFDSPVLQTVMETAGNDDGAYHLCQELLFGTTYYWRVRDCHAVDTSEWSPTWQFTTYYRASLSTPTNGTTDVNYSSATLYFKYVTRIRYYQMQLDTVPTFDSPLLSSHIEEATGSGNAYHTYKNLLQGTDYYWRVRNYHSKDTSDWSVTWNFTTKTTLPATTLLQPANQTSGYDYQSAVFSWSAVDNAVAYRLQIADNGQFEPCIVDQQTTTTTATVDLPPSSVLYWRVQVLYTDGRSQWSPIYGVNTSATPTAIETPHINKPTKEAYSKQIKEGKLFILRSDGSYDILGRKIK